MTILSGERVHSRVNLENGKKPYAKSTLMQKINVLDIIDELDMWSGISECMDAIRMSLIV